MRSIFARDVLPPPPERDPVTHPRRGAARLLLAPERLGVDPEAPPRRRRGLAALLFSLETLPPPPAGEEGTRARRRRRRWLRLLFAPEPLDP